VTHTILVTGGAGYIGGTASELLLDEGFNVIILDDLSTGHKELITNKTPFYNSKIGDTEELNKIFSNHKIDAVIHFAGAALVHESMQNPKKYFDINFCQAQNLLNVMNKHNVKNFIFSSTCAIYGIPDKDEIPIKEETIPKPINPYGESKLLFETSLKWEKESNNLNFIALRYFNVAGSSKQHFENHKPETHLIPLAVNAAKSNNTLKIYGNDYQTQDGTAIRDYVHVVDLINAHLCALKALIEKKNRSYIYNVGYGVGYSVFEIVNAVQEVLKTQVKYSITDRRSGDPPILIANSEKIKKELNWKPKHNNINEIIESTSRFIT